MSQILLSGTGGGSRTRHIFMAWLDNSILAWRATPVTFQGLGEADQFLKRASRVLCLVGHGRRLLRLPSEQAYNIAICLSINRQEYLMKVISILRSLFPG